MEGGFQEYIESRLLTLSVVDAVIGVPMGILVVAMANVWHLVGYVYCFNFVAVVGSLLTIAVIYNGRIRMDMDSFMIGFKYLQLGVKIGTFVALVVIILGTMAAADDRRLAHFECDKDLFARNETAEDEDEGDPEQVIVQCIFWHHWWLLILVLIDCLICSILYCAFIATFNRLLKRELADIAWNRRSPSPFMTSASGSRPELEAGMSGTLELRNIEGTPRLVLS